MVLRQRMAAGALFLTGLLCLIINSGYSYGPAVLALMGVWAIRQRPDLLAEGRVLMVVVLLFAVGQAGLAVLHNEGWKRAESYLHFLLAIPVAWAVVRARVTALPWFVGVALGGVAAAGWAVWQHAVLGVERATGFTYVIQHGDIGMLMGVTSITGWLYFQAEPQRKGWAILMVLGAVGGLLTSLLSGTRGGWVGLPVVAWLLWRALAPALSVQLKRWLVLLLLVLPVVLVGLPQTGVQARVGQAVDELVRLQAGDLSGESVVPRLYMWQMGAGLIVQRPLLGWGQAAFDTERDRQMAAGETALTLPTNHLHSEIIDTGVKHGLLGAALLALLYGGVLWVFRRGLQVPEPELRALATSGFLLAVLYIDFGLSQTMFYRNSGRVVFIAWLGITYGLWVNERRRHSDRIEASA